MTTATAPTDSTRALLRKRPEILAPAGTPEMMRAAVENGADAIYFGLQQFNARLRANNFNVDDLPSIMAGLHERGVKGYVTMNTLIFSEEMEAAKDTLIACSNAGVDAVLIQDLGLAELANRLVPNLPVHASTQMTVTCAESVHALESLGIRLERVVAARELSRKELRRMGQDTDAEVEVFVHGAICVAYSGQCLTSEALGGRSANRGECAQACRLPYDLFVDGEQRDLGSEKYLLSPKDLSAFEDIGDLADIGIVSLKIEGRLKSPQYVAATVKAYRKAVDEAFSGKDPILDEQSRRMLEMTFSRGFTKGYIHEINHQAVVEGKYSKKRGLFLGTVKHVQRNGIVARIEGPLKPGDGVVFGNDADRAEEGGRLYEIFRTGTPIKSFDPLVDGVPSIEAVLRFGDGRINFYEVKPGDTIWKTSDPALDAELASSYAEGKIHHHRPVHAVVRAAVDEPLSLTLRDEEGRAVTLLDSLPAETALKRPLTEEVLRDQLGRMGNTPFELATLTANLQGDVMVPLSRLNDLRRRAVDALVEVRRCAPARRVQANALQESRSHDPHEAQVLPTPPALSVLCRTLAQVEAAVAIGGVHMIYTGFEDIRLHKEARKLIPTGGPRFAPATLRIVKPGEASFVRILLQSEPDAILVRNLASWQIIRAQNADLEMIADYAINIANDLTARLIHRHGFALQTPSYDLNITQLLDLIKHVPAHWFEVTLHQYMPMFHMEHCVFCRFLSTGTDFTNCGRPCEDHEITLRDRVGQKHPVKADAGCRNTVFNAVPQSASEYVNQLLASGVRRFRADFLSENPAEVRAVLEAYRKVLSGERSGQELWRELRASSKLGVTRGSLDYE